jgi:hypothetical protein
VPRAPTSLLSQKTRQNISRFYEPVPMPGGYSFSHVETLRMIDLYYNSKYKTGQYDNLGYRKFFLNINKPACDIATKFIDLDTKDIILMPEGNDDELKVWFMQKKLKQWLKDTDFAVLLNEIAVDLPKYGTVVIKKVGKEWKKVNIQNLRMDPKVLSLKHSPFVIELVDMAKHEIDETNWDTEELYARGDEASYLIYDEYVRKGKGWKRTVYGDLFSTKDGNSYNRSVESETDKRDDYCGALELYTEEVSELPYRELHWEKVPGRWLGYGFVEYLEENQIALNETENLERKGLLFSSLQLFQTRDPNAQGSNILTDTKNGDLMYVESEITKVATEERNLAAYNNTRANWNANTERKTFTSDITTGGSLPSRTPLGVANLQASFASSYFELKRENFGLFIKKLLQDDIIPSFVKENSKEHILMFASSDKDMELLDKLIAEIKVGEAAIQYAETHGFYPSGLMQEEAKQKIKDSLKADKNRFLKIGRGFYRNCKYYVDIVITGENVDNGTKSQVIQMLMQIAGQNPMALQDPFMRSLIFAFASLGGISLGDLGLLNEAPEPNPMLAQMGQAGSMAKPLPMQAGGQVMSNTQL